MIIDSDEADVPGPLDDAIRDGLALDRASGSKHRYRLPIHPQADNGLKAFAYTSGTTARPKGVDFLHQGAYLASLANVAEFGSMRPAGTGWYLWALPMFHAMGLPSRPLSPPTRGRPAPGDMPRSVLHLGRYGCQGSPFLHKEDRLSRYLAAAKAGAHHSPLRCLDRQHAAV